MIWQQVVQDSSHIQAESLINDYKSENELGSMGQEHTDSNKFKIIVRHTYPPKSMIVHHDDVIKCKKKRHWPFVRGIHRPPLVSPHKGQWVGARIFFFDLRLNKWLSSRRRWFETSSRPLWRHCNVELYRRTNWHRWLPKNFRSLESLSKIELILAWYSSDYKV